MTDTTENCKSYYDIAMHNTFKAVTELAWIGTLMTNTNLKQNLANIDKSITNAKADIGKADKYFELFFSNKCTITDVDSEKRDRYDAFAHRIFEAEEEWNY